MLNVNDLNFRNDLKKLKRFVKINNFLKTYTILFHVASLFCVYTTAFLLRLGIFKDSYRQNVTRFIEISAMLISVFSLISIISIIVYDEQKNKLGLKIKKSIMQIGQELHDLPHSSRQNNQSIRLEKLDAAHKSLVLTKIARVVHCLNLLAVLVFVTMEVLAVIEWYKGYGFSVLHSTLKLPLTFHSLIDTIGLTIFTIVSLITLTAHVIRVYEKSMSSSEQNENNKCRIKHYLSREIVLAGIALITTVLHLVGRILCGLETAKTVNIPYGDGTFSIGFTLRIVSVITFITFVALIPIYFNMNQTEYQKSELYSLDTISEPSSSISMDVKIPNIELGQYAEPGLAQLST